MISDREMARTVSAFLVDLSASLDRSMADVAARCPESEAREYRMAVRRIMEGIHFDVLLPLYLTHPGLRTKEMPE